MSVNCHFVMVLSESWNTRVLRRPCADPVSSYCLSPGMSEYLDVGALTFSHATAGVLECRSTWMSVH